MADSNSNIANEQTGVASTGLRPSQSDANTQSSSQEQRGPREGRGRGRRGGHSRGRGRGRGDAATARFFQSDTGADYSHGRPPGGGFGARLTEARPNIQGEVKALKQDIGAQETVTDDGEVCFICASPIEHTSIAPCNHQTCHICSLRLRALYKTRACAHCRTEAPFVIFTNNPEKHFQDFDDQDFAKIDENLGIKYEKADILEDTILLLRYNCPDKDCDVACLGWPDLHRHVRTKHGRVMCDLCTRNKKVFTHEHELFTFGELRKHEKFGDDNPGAIDQSGFKGHPECGFCKQRFYGDDELYNHCREKHERCHICDRRNGGRHPQYYLNYQELEKHFADVHFVCLDAECQANKTNVFESEMDLKAHQLSEHPNGLSKDARRDARLVNLSGFDLRTPYQSPGRGGRERGAERGTGRGRDPNVEPIPNSSAQPLGRAELAYQRQLAIQSSQSVSTRNFGGQLTQSVATPRPQPTTPSAAPANPPSQTPKLPSLDTLSLTNDDTPPQSQNPQEQARQIRHEGVTNRASSLLKNDTVKLTQFRTHISSYNSNKVTASDLIDAFFGLFDAPAAELGKLIRELADLFETDDKRQSLLTAWNNWRSINEDYPSLPAPSGVSLPPTNVFGGRRVLKLKSSTAQSSRSAVSRSGSWGTAAAAPLPLNNTNNSGARQSEAFPSLPSSMQGKKASTPVWANATTASNSSSSSRPSSSKQQARPNASIDLFPSLPAAAKPNVLMPGFNTRGSVRWGAAESGSRSPWANGASNAAPVPVGTVNEEHGGGDETEKSKLKAATGKGKGKNKKGELLFHFG